MDMRTNTGMTNRAFDRAFDELRPLSISYDQYGYATVSILFQLGATKVLCAVSLQQGVPPFLRGKRTGWLTAEYAMLPTSTTIRTVRESSQHQRNGRSVEISRLIGRCLRSSLSLDALGEQTIYIDCDVLQADGGTRTACITAASLALYVAVARWRNAGLISESVIVNPLAAVSVGLVGTNLLLDLDCKEDNSCGADFNIILTRAYTIVEIQGTAEKVPLSWEQFEQVRFLAQCGVEKLFTLLEHPATVAALATDLPTIRHSPLQKTV